MKILKKSVTKWIFILFFYLLLFQNPLELKISILSSLDELVSILMILVSILIVLKEKSMNKYNFRILISMIILYIWGISSNYIYDYQLIKYALIDFIIESKGFGVFISAFMIFRYLDINTYKKTLNVQLKSISIVIFLLVIVNLVLKIFPIGEVRFGIPTQQLFFSHQTYLASFCILIIAILTAFMEENKNNILNILLLFVVIIMTGRTKAIVMIPIYYVMYYIIILKNKLIDFKKLAELGSVVITFAYEKISIYLSNDDWARSALTKTSFQIAKDKFPFGAGAGTFGSWISGQYYSELYYEYGLNIIYGLSPNFYMYVADTFWPMVLGQFGFIGILLVFNILFQIYKLIRANKDKNNHYYLAQMIIFVYLLILSTAESSYTSPIAVIYFIVIILLNERTIMQ